MQRDPITIEENCRVEACRREGDEVGRMLCNNVLWMNHSGFLSFIPNPILQSEHFSNSSDSLYPHYQNANPSHQMSCLDYDRFFHWSSMIFSWTPNFHSSQLIFHAAARVMFLKPKSDHVTSLPSLTYYFRIIHQASHDTKSSLFIDSYNTTLSLFTAHQITWSLFCFLLLQLLHFYMQHSSPSLSVVRLFSFFKSQLK